VTYNPRTVARDQLWKLPEVAKERTQSQTNIRTVLFDPFQSQQTPAKVENQAEQSQPQEDPTPFSKHVSGNVLLPPASLDTSSSRFFPTTLVPQLQKPPSPAFSNTTNDLLNSFVDSPQKPAYIQTTEKVQNPIIVDGVKQTLKAPFFVEATGLGSSILRGEGDEIYDERLQEWWKSGNTFARQEEFYQSLLRVREASTGGPQTTRRHPPGPIGPPSSSSSTRLPCSTSESMTTITGSTPDHTARLLIPMIENLQAYTQGPQEKRRDYFCQWSKAPDWAIDTSENGNNSFYDKDWGTPPARLGRDPRYVGYGSEVKERTTVAEMRERPYGRAGSGAGFGSHVTGVLVGIDRRFGIGFGRA
jgi:hypothetical protein